MTTACDVVRYTPEHKQRLAELESALWCGDLPTSIRYLEWKYEENPYLAEPVIYLAYLGDRLVGARGFYGARWEAGTGSARIVTTIPVADDLIVAPDHRDRGLVTRIMRAALEDLGRLGYRQVLNLSGGEVTVVGSLAMGWKSAGPLEPVGINPAATVRGRLRAALRRTRLIWRFADSPVLHSGPERVPFQQLDRAALREPVVLAREPRSDAMSRLVERLGSDGRIRHVRNPEFFEWRYRNPLRSYRYLYAGAGDRLDGYLVLRAPHPPGEDTAGIRIVDLEFSSPEVRDLLLDTAVEAAGPAGLYAWGATLPADALRRLQERGVGPVSLQARSHGCPCVLVKSLGPPGDSGALQVGGRRLSALADWDLRMIHTMAG